MQSHQTGVLMRTRFDAPLRAEPQQSAKAVCSVPGGAPVRLVEFEPPWQCVETESGDVGWLTVDESPGYARHCEELDWLDGGGEVLDTARLDEALCHVPAGTRAQLEALRGEAQPLQALFDAARGALRGGDLDRECFAALLGTLPAAPRSPIRRLTTGLPAPGLQPRVCLLPLPAFGLIGAAIFELALGLGKPGERAFDAAVWAGLSAVDQLALRLRPLELVHHAVHRWDDVGSNISVERVAHVALQSRGFGPSVDALGPSLGFPPMDLCRFERWWEGTRGLRCWCDAWYQIREVVPCDGASAPCIGDCVEIRGEGFGPRRFFDGFGPALRNKVFFQGMRTRIEATTFLPLPATDTEPEDLDGWSDTRIRVAVPPEAVSGDVTLEIHCRRQNAAWPSVDFFEVDCGGRFRHRRVDRRHLWSPAADIEAPVVAHISAGGTTVDSDAPGTLRTEACRPVRVTFVADHVDPETWRVVDDTGTEVVPDEATDAGRRRTWTVSYDGNASRTYTLTAGNRCGPPVTRTLTIDRFWAVTLAPPETRLRPGETTTLEASTSCPLSEDGVIQIRLPDGSHGVVVPGTTDTGFVRTLDLPVPAGSSGVPVEVRAHPVDCGRVPMSARLLSGSPRTHASGRAIVHADPGIVTSDVEGSIWVRSFVDDAGEAAGEFSSGDFPFGAVFALDRLSAVFDFVNYDWAGNGVRRNNPGVPAAFEAETGHMDIVLDLSIGGPLVSPSGETRVVLDMSTRTAPRPPSGTRPSASRFQRSPDTLSGAGFLA
ncbi:MAG: SH3 domain-containing protein, partial [Myxococcota bacterium]